VHFDGGQARNNQTPLRLAEDGCDTVGSRFLLV
jgi:hypothetical protein